MASLYTAYFDESGTHPESDAAVVAGFVFDVTQWEAFSEKWRKVLTEFGVDFMHMTDLENRRRQFTGWSVAKKEELLNLLLPIIHDHTFRSVGVVVFKKSFDALLSDPVKQICGDQYGLATLVCWRHLGLVMQEWDGWINCTMESGAQGAGALLLIHTEDSKFTTWHNEHRILNLSFADKREFLPLQAADILAYELYKDVPRQFGKANRKARYPLRILGQKTHQWHYIQEKHLIELNEDITRQVLERFGQAS